ncbi:MAG: LysR family transcriptional regulator [Alphaproteobacteria bacterium]
MPTIKSKLQFLKELIALKEVTDTGKIGSAALKNGLKSTNLSKLITSLEERLHIRLIARTSKGITPLEEAVKINETTDKIVSLLETLFFEYGDRKKLSGCISIWTEEDYIGDYFLEKLQKFLHNYPLLKIKIFSGDKIHLSQMDLIISSDKIALTDTRSLYTKEVNSYFYISDQYIQKHGRPKNLKDILENHFLCMRHCDVAHKDALSIIKNARHLNITVDETSIIFRIILNGDAIGILPEWCEHINPSVFRVEHLSVKLTRNFNVMYNMKTKNVFIMNLVLSFIKKFVEERDRLKKKTA